MLYIGWRTSKKGKNNKDYFRGGQRIPWWAAGLSLFATGASAISLVAMPAKSFAENWIYVSTSIFAILTLPITIYFIVPLARRLQVATAFEYLERRFHPVVRFYGSIVFSLSQMVGRMAAIMLLPALALSAICGIPMHISILLMGLLTTIYASMGGLSAVIWTDVIQALVMIAAMVLCAVWVIFSIDYDFSTAMSILDQSNKLQVIDWSFDLAAPIIYVLVLVHLILPIGALGDQNFIQRVQSTADEKTAVKAAVTQMFVAVPLNFLLFSLGTLLFLYYYQNPQMLTPAMKNDSVFPLFAAQVLPSGLGGVIMTAIMAATMSTLSSAVNSVANIGVEDFFRPLRPQTTDRGFLIAGKLFTVALGIFGTGVALLLAYTPLDSIWDLFILVSGIIYAPLIGIYCLGIFTKRTNALGAGIGLIGGIGVGVALKYLNLFPAHAFTYTLITQTVCMAAGYFISIIIPGKPQDLTGLTAYTLPPKESTEQKQSSQSAEVSA
ncbi:sodium/solute symporter [Planctomycetota bacterium]|nr:sodium/solute symporter [Planctomycetota bacterium]